MLMFQTRASIKQPGDAGLDLLPAESSGDETLLDRALAGDADAFCELCRGYESRLFRQAIVVCGNETIASDLAQETLVEAWRCLRRYNGRCQFFTWLCAILLHRHRNSLRRKAGVSMASIPDAERIKVQNRLDGLVDGALSPDEAAQQREESTLVLHCIQALPPKHFQIIYLRFYVDHSLEGIAAALGCSIGTVKSRLFHALEKLRGMKLLSAEAGALKMKAGSL